eukprot:TRINITY_DN4312_c0_g1_i1.p1 TRINITY_DN4312_c0_g1~~TRINITY_DN4312_c0_g1_i1.p1  ORF type:complete len:491 (+),score=92.09 TRINITY_DN4312_c0_g1_i1:160-1632(+)
MKPAGTSSRPITPGRALTPMGSGPPKIQRNSNKLGTPGTNVTSLTAFNAGALFPRTGDDVLQNVRELLVSAIQSMRGEIASIMETQEQKLASKLDVIMRSVVNMSDVIGEGALHREREAFASQSADQHSKISEQLRQVLQHLEDVHKRSEMDEFALRLLERMDLPCIFDMKMTSLTHRFREFQLESKSHTEKVVQTVEEIASQTVNSLANETGNSINEMKDELQRRQDVTSEEFHILLSEISRIQQGLGLDYSKASSAPKCRAQTMRLLNDDDDDDPSATQASAQRPKKLLSQKTTSMHTVKRHRDVGLQSESNNMDNWSQTDADLMKGKVKKPLPTSAPTHNNRNSVQEAESMKVKARKALVTPQYNVMDYYRTDGFCQAVARNPQFENLTLFVICVNAIWIAIDIDLNNAQLFLECLPVSLRRTQCRTVDQGSDGDRSTVDLRGSEQRRSRTERGQACEELDDHVSAAGAGHCSGVESLCQKEQAKRP